jgi:hypothetical protein
MLQRANQLMAAGDYADAAAVFADLAQRAEGSFPQRTPFLYIEAGRAAIFGGQTKIGAAHLRRGLTLLASQGRIPRMRMLGQRVEDELRARGLNPEADEIFTLINADMPKQIQSDVPKTAKPILPTHCPSCGAAIRPDEIEWLDDVTAECDYCGSPVRG